MEYEIRQVGLSAADFVRDAAFLKSVFPRAWMYSPEYLRWQYAENPEGPALGFNAFTNGEQAGHYATQPMRATLDGNSETGLVALSASVAPRHHGCGIFTRIAAATHDLGARNGFTFVVAIANANSTPGFIGRLGFQFVGSLRVRIGLGRPGFDRAAQPGFRRMWTSEAMDWRLSNPSARYHSNHAGLFSESRIPFIRMLIRSAAEPRAPKRGADFFFLSHPLTAWIGAYPGLRWRGVAMGIPPKLKPSPLNLVFKDLTGQGRELVPDRVFFEAIDFDPY